MDEDELEKASLIVKLPPVLEMTFRHLSAKQLNTCAQVCKSWRSLANATKQKRKPKISCFYYYYCQKKECSAPSFPICSHKKYKCFHTFEDDLNSLPYEPVHTIFFATQYRYPCLDVLSQPLCRDKKKASSYQVYPCGKDSSFPYLPKSCCVGYCLALGITGQFFEKPPNDDEAFIPSFSVLYIPAIPGLEVYQFPLTNIEDTSDAAISSYTGIPENSKVKCMLGFVNQISFRSHAIHTVMQYNNLWFYYLAKSNWKMALGVTAVDSMVLPKCTDELNSQRCGIAFAGDNVEAASIAIQPGTTKPEIFRTFEVFKESGLIKGQCFAIILTSKKHKKFYENDSMEKDVFCELFPNVPIIGVIGTTNHIGINSMSNTSDNVFEARNVLVKYNTMVFVIISVRN